MTSVVLLSFCRHFFVFAMLLRAARTTSCRDSRSFSSWLETSFFKVSSAILFVPALLSAWPICSSSLIFSVFPFDWALFSNSNHGTRLSSSGVCVDRPRTEAWKRSTAYRAQKLWNSLPSDLRGIKNLAAFKIAAFRVTESRVEFPGEKSPVRSRHCFSIVCRCSQEVFISQQR